VTPRRLTAQLAAGHQLADKFYAAAGPVLDLLAVTAPDGYPGGGEGVRGSSELTSVERAVEARLRDANAQDWQIILAAHQTATRAFHDGLAAIDRHRRPDPTDTTRHRCTGGMGLPGHLNWGRPDCTNIVPDNRRNAGLCDACRMRRQRWQRKGDTA
jgi:hypothetical protein